MIVFQIASEFSRRKYQFHLSCEHLHLSNWTTRVPHCSTLRLTPSPPKHLGRNKTKAGTPDCITKFCCKRRNNTGVLIARMQYTPACKLRGKSLQLSPSARGPRRRQAGEADVDVLVQTIITDCAERYFFTMFFTFVKSQIFTLEQHSTWPSTSASQSALIYK